MTLSRGGRALGAACGVLSFRGWEAYSELIGGKPAPDFYHPPYGPFAVHIDDASHPITANMVDFAVRDELYANVQLTSQARLLAHATLNGKSQPTAVGIRTSADARVHATLGPRSRGPSSIPARLPF